MVGVADVVALRLLAHHQRSHVEAGHQIGRTQHQRLHPRAGGDGVNVAQALRILDLRVDADAANRQAVGEFELGEQEVECVDVGRVGHLGQDDDVERRSGRRYDVDDVEVGPRCGPVVHPHTAQLRAPPRPGQCRGHQPAGNRFRVRSDGILQIEEHLVGGKALGLLDHPGVAARNR